MPKSLLKQLLTKDGTLINIHLLDATTRAVIKHLKESTEFCITLESFGLLVNRNLLLKGGASTSTGSENLVLIRQFNSTKPATYHVYRNEKKDYILTKKVAEVVKKERDKIGAR
ncbi:hypothetical protein LCGC14_0347430 [marine sediment metagenome]|uniref:Uncharacterized protein n=1 Tax=marine sediment metagenome TaxID=412755 RepID=A0A0F9VZ17_9ZZZZ